MKEIYETSEGDYNNGSKSWPNQIFEKVPVMTEIMMGVDTTMSFLVILVIESCTTMTLSNDGFG